MSAILDTGENRTVFGGIQTADLKLQNRGSDIRMQENPELIPDNLFFLLKASGL